MSLATKDKVVIPRSEYDRLKKLDSKFRVFLAYLEEMMDIKEAREEIKKGKFISQEKLFRKLGL